MAGLLIKSTFVGQTIDGEFAGNYQASLSNKITLVRAKREIVSRTMKNIKAKRKHEGTTLGKEKKHLCKNKNVAAGHRRLNRDQRKPLGW